MSRYWSGMGRRSRWNFWQRWVVANGPNCHYCAREIFYRSEFKHNLATIDHVIPLSMGGYKGRDNMVWACDPCNQQKGASTSLQTRRKSDRLTVKLAMATLLNDLSGQACRYKNKDGNLSYGKVTSYVERAGGIVYAICVSLTGELFDVPLSDVILIKEKDLP